MPTFTRGEISIDVDEDGFIQQPENWNQAVAAALGTTEGVENLTEEDLRALPLRSGQGGLQGGRPSEAHRVRLALRRRSL
jgi:hypothetical protein